MSEQSAATDGRDAQSAAGETGAMFRRGRRRGLVTGLKAGAVATTVMSAFREPVSRSPPPTAWFWAKFVGGGDPGDHPLPAMLLHLVYGAGGGAVFGALLGPHPGDSEVEREKRGALAGLGYGLLLSGFGIVVVLKRLLDLDLEPHERFVFHVSHVVYGLTLGTFFGSRV